jgi:hypothetical protein
MSMRNYLVTALAGAALTACQQQSATEPTASESAAAQAGAMPAAASGTPAAQVDPAAHNGAAPAGAPSEAPAAADVPAAPSGSGYDWAEAHNIDDVKDCTVGDEDFRQGCQLYVNEKGVEEGEQEFEGEDE